MRPVRPIFISTRFASDEMSRYLHSDDLLERFVQGVDRMKIAFTVTAADGADCLANCRRRIWFIDDVSQLVHVISSLSAKALGSVRTRSGSDGIKSVLNQKRDLQRA